MKVKRFAGILVCLAMGLGLSACYPTKQEELSEWAKLSEQCREAGGRYVLTTPPGYVSASYWCLWDEERKGGEW